MLKLLGLFVITVAVFGYSLCKAAAKADDRQTKDEYEKWRGV